MTDHNSTGSTDGAAPSWDIEAFKYALEYFKYHASQRYRSFQFFLLQLFLIPVAAAAAR